MGHNLDITNGVASYADSAARADGRTDAWHALGQTINREMAPAEALELAHMSGWDVRKIAHEQTVVGEDGVDVVRAKGLHTVLRTNPHTRRPEALGVVGDQWQPVQNEATTDLLYGITEESGAHIATIGALDGGRQTFVTMKMPTDIVLTGANGFRDTTVLYLAVLNRHDGKGSLRALVSPVRIVCANTQAMAEGSAVSSMTLRHVGDPRARLEEIRAVLGVTARYTKTYAEAVAVKASTERDDEYVRNVLNEVFGVTEPGIGEQQQKYRVRTVSKVVELYRTSPNIQPFYGTAYGAYNAVTEYLDHYAPARPPKGADVGQHRAFRTLTSSSVAAIKSKAFAWL